MNGFDVGGGNEAHKALKCSFLYCKRFSVVATITNVLLLLFANVNEVAFLLITCQNIGDGNNVVFIDGTVQCDGPGQEENC